MRENLSSHVRPAFPLAVAVTGIAQQADPLRNKSHATEEFAEVTAPYGVRLPMSEPTLHHQPALQAFERIIDQMIVMKGDGARLITAARASFDPEGQRTVEIVGWDFRAAHHQRLSRSAY
jgi:hypothetical protein